MTVISEIEKLKTNISNAYNALENKCADLPLIQNSENLSTSAETLPPVYKCGICVKDIVGDIDSDGNYVPNTRAVTITNMTSSIPRWLNYIKPTSLTSNSLTVIPSMFANTYLTSVNLPKATLLPSNAFKDCSSLVSVTTGLITLTVSKDGAYAFSGCINLTNPVKDIYSVEYGGDYICNECTGLTNVSFTNLVSVKGGVLTHAFQNCVNLRSVSFPMLTSITNGGNTTFFWMLEGCSNVTVHFRSDMQSTISALPQVGIGFRGTNTTVLYDL